VPRFLEPAEKAAVADLVNPADGILGLAAARLGAMHRAENGNGLDSISTVAVTQHLDILGGAENAFFLRSQFSIQNDHHCTKTGSGQTNKEKVDKKKKERGVFFSAGVQGGAERIATTPLPFPYQLLVHRTAYLYILLAPFAMAEDMGERQQRVLFGVPFVYKDELFTKTGSGQA
jgi:hypothetical protein